MKYIIGKKAGMSRLFLENGSSIPVTLIYLIDNYIIDIYNNINNISKLKITIKSNNNKINKSILGVFKKNNIKVNKIWEFNNFNKYKNSDIGNKIDISFLKDIKKVDITGYSKGKGFSGVIKRWNFKSQDSTHGNSLSHRAPGSIGQNQSPGRVFKNKKMSGHYGCVKVTTKNLKIIDFNINNKILVIKGSCSGLIGSNLIIKSI
ncbi:50S ribosomal protein L3 [endosymbiont of Pachyrhynchus infernalis]|uniref:50S ribosomal protein L3 n=1 Tax=endosymbiont of Pachyrhynchus infernalis TaxID=1971488 RepID=UPI000DC73A9B|nr:50S ribosomal protein L3 [endosymbiont of Pachyrhynchus infernalis]BBA84832.1 50S ribosomal protein L3 [endosymbiont of Pachyrhynchus infernalis]